jgi:hypothetical protein
MERPKKEDYDFNDYLEGVRFAINITKYVDYLEAKQLPIHGVGISFCFDDDEISDLVTDWINGFKNITARTKTNLEFGFQEGIYKIKEVLKK